MKYSSFFIPGLGMNISEVDLGDSILGIQNPGFGDYCPPLFHESYTLEDVADAHLETILENYDSSSPLILNGMSLGGMIVAIIAAKHAERLPKRIFLNFFVTGANSPTLPLFSSAEIESWNKVKDIESFEKILEPFCSMNFINRNTEAFKDYVKYRSRKGNGQRSKDYHLQVEALLKFNGDQYFPNIWPHNCTFIFGGKDRIINHTQIEYLKQLLPNARFQVLSHIGHMINLEEPTAIKNYGGLNEIREKTF